MPDTPLDLLAKELGARAGRIEREHDLRLTAAVADFDRRIAQFELRMTEFEHKAAAVKDGEKGEPGEPGQDGPAGVAGEPGQKGSPGEPGSQGPPGEPGKDGQQGIQGERGPQGEAGKLPIARAWTDQVYYAGSVVTHEGSTWQASCDTGRAPPHEDWICLAQAGRDGADGTSFRVRGTWDSAADYDALDMVVLNGGAFVARKNDPGACPGAGWQLLASQGKQGKPGEKGSPGPKGERGENGASIIGMDIDDQGIVTLLRDDGVVITCDFYPLFAKLSRR